MVLTLRFGQLKFQLEGQRIKIGRVPGNDLVIADPMVSSKHAIINCGFLLDSGSTNGTLLNKQKAICNQKIRLAAGDVLRFGDSQVFIEDDQVHSDNVTKNGDAISGSETSSSNSTNNSATSDQGDGSGDNGDDSNGGSGLVKIQEEAEDSTNFQPKSALHPQPISVLVPAPAHSNTISTPLGTQTSAALISTSINKVIPKMTTIQQITSSQQTSSSLPSPSSGPGSALSGNSESERSASSDGWSGSESRPESESDWTSEAHGGHERKPSMEDMTEEISKLQRALSKSEVESNQLKKSAKFINRRTQLLQQKSKMTKLDVTLSNVVSNLKEEIDNLKYQLLYGDTEKDKQMAEFTIQLQRADERIKSDDRIINQLKEDFKKVLGGQVVQVFAVVEDQKKENQLLRQTVTDLQASERRLQEQQQLCRINIEDLQNQLKRAYPDQANQTDDQDDT